MSTITLAPVRPVAPALRPGPSQVRLTRRGRLVLFLAALVAVLSLATFVTAGSVATDERGPETTQIIMVGTGETLWGIAAEVAAATGEDDVVTVVEQIKELNDLESGMLLAGQRLRVPVH